MLTIDVPDEVAVPLADQAARQGFTPAELALDHLRALVVSPPAGEAALLAEAALVDGLRPEEDAAWAHLQPTRR